MSKIEGSIEGAIGCSTCRRTPTPVIVAGKRIRKVAIRRRNDGPVLVCLREALKEQPPLPTEKIINPALPEPLPAATPIRGWGNRDSRQWRGSLGGFRMGSRRGVAASEGDFYRPFRTLAEGTAAVASGGTIRIVPGASAERGALGLGKRMRIKAPAGGAGTRSAAA
jgi:hypothetical protein